MPDGQLFATITHGVRTMPAYGPQIPDAGSLGHRRLRPRARDEPDGRGQPLATGAEEVSTTEQSETPIAERPGRDYRIPAKSRWAGAWKIAAGIGVARPRRRPPTATQSTPSASPSRTCSRSSSPLSLALGSLFFVMVHYITKASWGVTVRRVAELFMRPMPIFAILVIPLVLLLPHLFPWLGAKHADGGAARRTPRQSTPAAAHAEPSPVEEARGNPAKEPAGVARLAGPEREADGEGGGGARSRRSSSTSAST